MRLAGAGGERPAHAVQGSGDLNLGNHTVNVSGSFSTTGAGTITMTSLLDSLKVQGDVLFDGGSTFGLAMGALALIAGGKRFLKTTRV